MLEVLRILKQRNAEPEVSDAKSAALLPRFVLRSSPIPSEVIEPAILGGKSPEKGSIAEKSRVRVRSTELVRLDPFQPDPDSLSRRRTRSAGNPFILLTSYIYFLIGLLIKH